VKVSDNTVDTNELKLNHIDPVPVKKLIMVVNAFTINTVDFLNKFAILSERKLSRIAMSIMRVDTMLNLLEVKLDSIPWLRDGSQPAAVPAAQGTVSNNAGPSSDAGAQPGQAAAAAAPVEEKAPEVKVVTVREDPRYAPFFRMIDRGVPIPALAAKCIAEGLDPALLNTPDDPAPPGGPSEGALVRVRNSSDSSSDEPEPDDDEFD
jgi:WASH complex subunit CCDC53